MIRRRSALPEKRLARYDQDYATAQENLMKAIVYDECMSTDVLEIQDIDKLGGKGDEVLV